MSTLVARTSLKRSPRTRTRKPSFSSQRKTRPPPLQIIPELSENEFEISPPPSPTPTQPLLVVSRRPNESPRVTLSAYTFSIDDAFLMFRDETPGSPTLSASSSSASSEDVPTTPGASDDEGSLRLPSPRINPRRITVRPLCINKPHSFMSLADEDLDILEKEATPQVSSFPARQLVDRLSPTSKGEDVSDDDYDFYIHELQDFISFYSECSSTTSAPRPDSIILSGEAAALATEALESKRRGRSRFSKPLPSLPPPTPPVNAAPSVPTSSSVQITAQNSLVRRKRNIPPVPNYPPPPPPPAVDSRPPPRVSVPADISTGDLVDDLGVSSKPPIVLEQVWFDEEDEDSIYSQPSSASTLHLNSAVLPAIASSEAALDRVSQPRKSTDSDAPRSSIESGASSQSFEAQSPVSPFSFPSTPSSSSHEYNDECESGPSPVLRSRWSTSTLGSVVEPSRTGTTALLSPLKSVFGGRSRRAINLSVSSRPPPSSRSRSHIRSPSKLPVNVNVFPTTPSPPTSPDRHVRRRGSRSSTSSTGTSRWSECESCESGGSLGNGLRRKPIPVEMFLRV